MLKIIVEDYNSFNDWCTNKREYCMDITKDEFFELNKKNWGNRLDFKFWDNLNDLRINISEHNHILINVKNIETIRKSNFINMIKEKI